MKNTFLCATLVAAALLAGCSSMEPPISAKPTADFDLVDPAKVDTRQYVQDYAQCSLLANQDGKDLSRTAANALSTAADKASMGVVGGRVSKHADRSTVLKRCLAGRGYTVLR
jgi:hypothetical protein